MGSSFRATPRSLPWRGLALAALGIAFSFSVAAAQDAPPSANPFKTAKERVSYGIGRTIGNNLKRDNLEVDLRLLLQGVQEALAGTKSVQTDEEFQAAIESMEKDIAAKTAADSKNFFAENAKKEGVKTTASGLQYQVIKLGTGKKPTADNQVKAHYTGTFLDGRKFDSSVDRGEPAVFPLRGVIPGWTEGVPLMPTGSKFKFWIPSDLAYGPNGRPPVIPPNSPLVFEIELLEVLPPRLPAPQP